MTVAHFEKKPVWYRESLQDPKHLGTSDVYLVWELYTGSWMMEKYLFGIAMQLNIRNACDFSNLSDKNIQRWFQTIAY